jgi:uncharacterized protein (TIGR02147 family)
MTLLATNDFDYREILLDVFNSRQKKNPAYSLRAFARDIEMSHSRLSEIFSGKGELSLEKAQNIAKKLRLSAIKAADFKDMVLIRTSEDERKKMAASRRLASRLKLLNQRNLSDDQFQIVANPKYSVVYTCMMLGFFDGSSESLVKLVDLNSIELYEILRRLERLELVGRRDGRWIAKPFKVNVDNGIPSEWVRAYHKEMLAAGRKAIDSVPMPFRYFDSLVLPIDLDRIGEIQQKMASFCQGLLEEYCSGKDAVYGVGLQFFPMSNISAENATLKI